MNINRNEIKQTVLLTNEGEINRLKMEISKLKQNNMKRLEEIALLHT